MNPFAALESDDEDDSFTKVQSNKKTDSKGTKKPAQVVQKPTTPSAPVVEATGGAGSNKASGRGGGGRGEHRNKGRGLGRGGKETGERKNGKREFDRRSGTGRGTEVSKGGAGKGGWGSNEDEIAHQRKELEESAAVEKTTEDKTDTVVEEEQQQTPVVEEPVEPEVPTFTLDEFLAKREASRQNSSIFSKVEERKVASDEFSGLKTKEEDLSSFIVLGGSKSKSVGNKAQRSTSQTKVTELGFHSAPKEEREDRGDRGGKGGKGGRGGRGDRAGRGDRSGRGGRGPRGGSNAGGKVDINDQSAFPSL